MSYYVNTKKEALKNKVPAAFIGPCALSRISMKMIVFAATMTLHASATPVDVMSDTWVATDGLGRRLPTAAEVGAPRADRTVTMFYFMTHGQNKHANYGPYDVSKILAADPNAINNPNSPLWGPIWHGHYWGEPLFGYYRSDDKAVIKKHAQMLADAGVDALALDFSNGFLYPEARTALFEAFAEVRAAGGQTPLIYFLLPFRWEPHTSQTVLQQNALVNIYRDFYAKNIHPELWFRWEGKPLILSYKSYTKMSDSPAERQEIESFFTFRGPFPTGNGKPKKPAGEKYEFLGHWAWREIYPQEQWYDFNGKLEEMTVSVSQNNNATHTVASTDPTCFSRAHCQGKDVITPENLAWGLNFQEQWDHALKYDPKMIFVTGWNEWGAARLKSFLNVKQPVVFADNFDAAHSRDAEPVKGFWGDAYYWQLVANIRRFKGVRAAEPVQSVPIRIDGAFDDWRLAAPLFRDTSGDPVARDFALCGKAGRYVDHSGRNDIVEARVSADAARVSFYVRTASPLVPGDAKNWMLLFVDADCDAMTGWLGYDLTIRPGAPPADVKVAAGACEIELSIPVSQLPGGVLPPQFEFKWADNCLEKKEWSDFTLHGDAAPNDRYNYRAVLRNGAPTDVHLAPGFQLGCRVTFDAQPKGETETELLLKPGEYLLRYDVHRGLVFFNFFVYLDGRWEPRVAYRSDLVLGHPYDIRAAWDGQRSSLQVDGQQNDLPRVGTPKASGRPVCEGTFKGRVADVSLRIVPSVKARLIDLRTEDSPPIEGVPTTVKGALFNVGSLPISNAVLVAAGRRGVRVEPERQVVDALQPIQEKTFSWRVDAGTNLDVDVTFDLMADGQRLAHVFKTFTFMPSREPAFAARDWQPPLRPVRTFHIDARAGDDARDGLTPQTAWRTFAKIAGRTLGPGDRLLLKRGSVFNEELVVTARGAADNWAEIAAYGAGPRPVIRRNRFIGDRCALIDRPAYLAVRDLVFCNAGKGLDIFCEGADCHDILVERCLAHHIEGLYRPNSHGIPEWRDQGGAPGGGGQIGGFGMMNARRAVLRDCEMYQCSYGFRVTGCETVLQRLYCHDNFCPNTSPHPFYTATRRAWLLDSVFDASGWQASCGTMGLMLAHNNGLVIRNCHFLNQPDSGSGDQGGIDFEARGDDCLIDRCTFRNNAGAAIEVLGLRSPQARNTRITRCRFDRNNYTHKLGPSEIFVWGQTVEREVLCSNGWITDNGYVLAPDVTFYTNQAVRTRPSWILSGNRAFTAADQLNRAFPYNDPPSLDMGAEVWTNATCASLAAAVSDDGRPGSVALAWEQLEGPADVSFDQPSAACTTARFPACGDYRLLLKADDGELWRTGRTAVHILPPGAHVRCAWTFARNLDAEGWTFGDLGTVRENFPSSRPIDSTFALPVHLVGGDYFVLAITNAPTAHFLSPDHLGLPATGTDVLVLRLQNHTDAARMRVTFITEASSDWTQAACCDFAVTPHDKADTVYRVPLAWKDRLRQLRLDFSAGSTPVTGTCRVDYICLENTR